MWGVDCTLFAFAQLGSLALISAAQPLFAIQDTYTGDAFFDSFNFFPFDDPTHGRVAKNYLSREEAVKKNLAYVSEGGSFVMRADHTSKVLPTSRGRDSIRIQSNASYSDSVIVLDLSHMPAGCATWPAFWTISAKGPWPQGGEIDSTYILFIEGVNRNTENLASLHTTPNCSMDTLRLMTGKVVSNNCDTQFNFNQGCGVNIRRPFSYGSGFNSVGGGWYVMRRTATDGVAIWFWPRSDITTPSAVKYGEPEIMPDIFTWGLPDVSFPFTQSCNANHFDAHQIIFDDTFCGDFAGAKYPTSGCPDTCVEFVDNNPEAFSEAYWEINVLRVYTPQY